MKTHKAFERWFLRLYVELLIFSALVLASAFLTSARVYAAANVTAFVLYFIFARIEYRLTKRRFMADWRNPTVVWKMMAFACFCWSFSSALSLGKAL